MESPPTPVNVGLDSTRSEGRRIALCYAATAVTGTRNSRADYRASALAVGICASVALLSWFGYRALAEGRSASIPLASRRASEAADLLVNALSRDMTGVQLSVLSS